MNREGREVLIEMSSGCIEPSLGVSRYNKLINYTNWMTQNELTVRTVFDNKGLDTNKKIV